MENHQRIRLEGHEGNFVWKCMNAIKIIQTKISGGSKGGAPGPNSFNFMQNLGKFGKIVCWGPPAPGELAPPSWGNPGSATEDNSLTLAIFKV